MIDRWHQLYKGNALSQRFQSGIALSEAEINKLHEYIGLWRERLMDLSWLMRRLNEFVSRQANYEDNCTGRFWEGRFKSQALLDEKALAACLAYVDLNPVRACMSNTPEESEFTSIKQRAEKAKTAYSANHPNQQVKSLMPFAGNPKHDMPFGLPFKLSDYLELVELTGRVIREDKRGRIPNKLPPILQRLNIEPDRWLKLTTSFESIFKDLVGSPTALGKAVELLDRKRRSNLKNCQTLLI